jgi:hypothetical protein
MVRGIMAILITPQDYSRSNSLQFHACSAEICAAVSAGFTVLTKQLEITYLGTAPERQKLPPNRSRLGPD